MNPTAIIALLVLIATVALITVVCFYGSSAVRRRKRLEEAEKESQEATAEEVIEEPEEESEKPWEPSDGLHFESIGRLMAVRKDGSEYNGPIHIMHEHLTDVLYIGVRSGFYPCESNWHILTPMLDADGKILTLDRYRSLMSRERDPALYES